MALPPEPNVEAAHDGITRIAIPRPFSGWSTPVVFIAIVANIATGNYLRSRLFFQAAMTFEQVTFAVACMLVTSSPFAVAYALWHFHRRRISREAKSLEPERSDASAAERYFQKMTTADMWDRSRAFTTWVQEQNSDTRVYVIYWHDEVAAIEPVKTPFEPRPIESEEPLPDASSEPENPAASGEGADSKGPGLLKSDGNKQSRRTIALIGTTMIAASILWVVVELAQSPRIQWLTEMVLPLTVTVLAGITIWGLRGLLVRDRWLLVPGGVVLRRSRGARAGVEILLFDRRKSVACVLELTDANWLVTLRSGQWLAQRRVAPDELTRFVRTWLSPIPPPVDRLVDLESS